MNYEIFYENPTQQYISVTAKINCEDLEVIELQFPAWRPGRYELGNFAKNIRNFKIVDVDNVAIPYQKISKDTWLVQTKNCAKIVVSYYYYAAELNAGSTFMDDIQLYVNPVNCLVYIKNRQNDPCQLKVNIPAEFQLACSANHNNNIISTESYHELVDSPFIASKNILHKTYTILNRTFHLWFQGNVDLDWNRVIADFKKFTKVQIEAFSNRREKIVGFPKKDYHFLFQILPIKAYHGVEHQHNTVIALGPNNKLMTTLYDDFLGVSSHELYHTWNIKAIRPKEMYPYDYSQENYSTLGYIAEGVTTYMGDLFLAASNVKDFNWYKIEFEKLLQKHFDNPGRFNYSVAESSWDTWLDGYVSGSPNRKVSIYNEGALLAFALDMKIRNNSNNKHSLHQVMNELYVNFAQKDKGYTELDYKQIAEKYAGEDLTNYFDSYVNGPAIFESLIVEGLETIGHELQMHDNPNYCQRILGIKTTIENNRTIIRQIYPGSGSDLAGLMLNDEIIAVNSQRVVENIEDLMFYFKDASITVSVNRMGRILDLLIPNMNRSFFPIYSIDLIPIPSNLNKRIFHKWCGDDLLTYKNRQS